LHIVAIVITVNITATFVVPSSIVISITFAIKSITIVEKMNVQMRKVFDFEIDDSKVAEMEPIIPFSGNRPDVRQEFSYVTPSSVYGYQNRACSYIH